MRPGPNAYNFAARFWSYIASFALCTVLWAAPASADTIEGQVLGAGAPIAKSTVTLWSARADAPKQLAQSQTGDDGRFTLSAEGSPDGILYIIAKGGEPTANQGGGDNPAIALISVLGGRPPAHVVINEFTTVASVWTNAQFFDGKAISGNALGLRIAAGNVSSFVDLATGGWGAATQDPLNSGQTPTMANFGTLADVLAGCVTRVTADACGKLFAASTGPKGDCTYRHVDRGAVDCPFSVVRAAENPRSAPAVLSTIRLQITCWRFRICLTSILHPALGCYRSGLTAAATAPAASRCSTAKVTCGSATTSLSVARERRIVAG